MSGDRRADVWAMDAAAATAIRESHMRSTVSMAVAAKALRVAKQQGAAAVELIAAAAKVAAPAGSPTGIGRLVDVSV
jgi:hypothetical protein